MKIGWAAVGLGVSTFIVPFIFIYNPELLGQGSLLNVVWACATAVMGVSAVSAASIGFLAAPLKLIERVLLAAGGLSLIIPGILTDSIGFGCFAFVFWRNSMRKGQ
jgi:TRAP-type uncharacterized transport system fused permease subunit